MRLNTQGSQFVFNLSSDIFPEEVSERYRSFLEKNWVQYENVIDYINSTIKEISFPGLSIPLTEQTVHYGKKINYKPVTNINDILSVRELQIIFRRVDSDMNYWMLYDLITYHYLDVTSSQKTHANPFEVKALDINRDVIYQINFRQVIFNNLSELLFSYAQQQFDEQTFTATIKFNFIDIIYKLDESKILQISNDGTRKIIDKNTGFKN